MFAAQVALHVEAVRAVQLRGQCGGLVELTHRGLEDFEQRVLVVRFCRHLGLLGRSWLRWGLGWVCFLLVHLL